MSDHWRCLVCPAGGEFVQPKSADSGAAAAHTKTTGHSTVTGIDGERLARVFGEAK